jgi:NAD(P)-dependent dehydrogenase (short-subunit alcohol dehydrogenase family)
MEIKDSVVLVTGGNRGIGEAFVRAFLAAGAAKVYCGARDPANAAHLVAEGEGRVVAVALDVTDAGSIAAAANFCDDVSILVNNAGQFSNLTLMRAPDLSAARQEMEVNYFGPLAMCRAFAPVLAKHKESAIVGVLSSAGIVALPNMGGYSPSKFAARAMCTSLRAELAPQGTQVIALIVGSVDTRMAAHVEGLKEPPSAIAAAGLRAIKRSLDEIDTDFMAIDVRAHNARDPKGLEMLLRRGLTAERVTTGR